MKTFILSPRAIKALKRIQKASHKIIKKSDNEILLLIAYCPKGVSHRQIE